MTDANVICPCVPLAPAREVEVWDSAVVVVENDLEIGIFPITARTTQDEALASAELSNASRDMFHALTTLVAILGGDKSTVPECVAALAVLARARGERP